jgi:hypothetical protein
VEAEVELELIRPFTPSASFEASPVESASASVLQR